MNRYLQLPWRPWLFLAIVYLVCTSGIPITQAAYGPNLITNPDVEISGTGDIPQGWVKGGFGANTRTHVYPVAGYVSSRAVRVGVTQYTAGDAKWYFSHVPVKPNTAYQFTDTYRSNTPSHIAAQYKLSSGQFIYREIGYRSASSDWRTVATTFTVPPDVVSLTMFHYLKSVGYLETDGFALREVTTTDTTKFSKGQISIVFDDGWKTAYDTAFPILNRAGFKATSFVITGRLPEGTFPGYIKVPDVLAMQSAGHEVGAHSRTHVKLTTLSTDAAWAEIKGSRDDLLAIGAHPVQVFAYPFGDYNTAIKTQVKNAGYSAGRSSDTGVNLKTQTPYALKSRALRNTTTFSEIQNYIDAALADRVWLILMFHRVDTSGTDYAVTPAFFQQTVDYIQQKNVTPITVSQGIALMGQ